jgi:predicted TIM-barrel fold metal-dependent hydrolase
LGVGFLETEFDMEETAVADHDTLTRSRPAAGAAMTYRTVDADQHLNPPQTFWQDYLPKRLLDVAPKVEHADDADYIVFEGQRRKLNLMSSQAGRKAQDFKMEGKLADVRLGNYDAAARIADMDADGVDAAVMYGGGPLGTSNMDLYIESFRAYNRYLKDFCDYDRRRLCGVAYIPMRDVDEALGLLREAAELGFTAVNIPGFPQQKDTTRAIGATGASESMAAQAAALTGDPMAEKQYDDPEWDRFWAAAVDLNITLTVHLGGRIVRFTNKKRLLSDMLMSKFAMAEVVSILIYGGVFDRHPKLRVATIESGGGWMAFAADYMDRTWEKQRFWTNSELKNPPSFYMEQNVWTSFIHDRVAIETRHLPGAKNIMWSTDYPHSETTFPDSAAWIERIFQGVPEADKHMILSERARKLFRIGE